MRRGRDRHAFLVEVIRHLSLVSSNANKWSVGMQTTGQVECKWVGKSVQLPSGADPAVKAPAKYRSKG